MAIIEGLELIDQLKNIVGQSGYRDGEDIDTKNYKDMMGSRSIRPPLLLRPQNTEQISQILKACNDARQPVTPQGGMTGLVSGAAPLDDEIVLSFERMKKVVEVDKFTSTMTVQAGVELQTIQETAEENNLLFPLDLGARGSCTIGGNLATNAGVVVPAREHGRTTVLNPAPMRPDFDADVLSYVDILVPNEMEFAALAGLDPETVVNMPAVELEAQARSLGVPTVIITLGVRGCLVSTPGRHALLPAHTGIEVVDTTGAGDAFVGGFAAGYVRLDGDLFGAAAWGNAAAALCVGRPGTAPAMPLENEVAELLESSTGPE